MAGGINFPMQDVQDSELNFTTYLNDYSVQVYKVWSNLKSFCCWKSCKQLLLSGNDPILHSSTRNTLIPAKLKKS